MPPDAQHGAKAMAVVPSVDRAIAPPDGDWFETYSRNNDNGIGSVPLVSLTVVSVEKEAIAYCHLMRCSRSRIGKASAIRRSAKLLIPRRNFSSASSVPRVEYWPTGSTRVAPPASHRGKRPFRGRRCRSRTALRAGRTPVNNRLRDGVARAMRGESTAPCRIRCKAVYLHLITALRGRGNPSGPHRSYRAAPATGHWSLSWQPPAGVTHAPLHHRPQDRPQLLTLRRQPVFDPWRVIAVATRRDDAGLDQPLQSIRKDVGRNTLRRAQEFGKAPLAADQIANHEERPSVADEIQGARDRAS